VTVTPDIQLQPGQQPGLAVGAWRLSPADSYASFAARLPLRRLRGRLPLTGHVLIAERVEESRALLIARTSAVRTGSQALDRVLTGPAFLDAGAFPDISFTSDLLVWVPSGWRAIGRLRVKNTEHEVACQFDVKFADPSASAPPRPVVCCRWALDSTWVTSQRIPGLDRRIEMTCSFELTADRQSDETSVRCDGRRTEMAASS
jgi:polyisoprenoid-binding protein YceI